MNVLSNGPLTSGNILARFTFEINLLPGEKYVSKSLYVGMLSLVFLHSLQNSEAISLARAYY